MKALRRLRWPALAVSLYAVFLIAWAPARWAGLVVESLSDGQITLSRARGVLRDGSAEFNLHAPGCAASVPLGRWSWRAGPDEGVPVALAVRAGDHPWARVTRVDGAWTVRALRAALPAETLCAIPAVAGYRPSGTLVVAVDHWRIGAEAAGRAWIDWRHARLGALSAAPAGDHRVRIDRSGDGPLRFSVEPLGGPLGVSARGEWFPAAALQAQGEIGVGAGGEVFRAWVASGTRPLSSDRFAFTLDLRAGPRTASRDTPRVPRS